MALLEIALGIAVADSGTLESLVVLEIMVEAFPCQACVDPYAMPLVPFHALGRAEQFLVGIILLPLQCLVFGPE